MSAKRVKKGRILFENSIFLLIHYESFWAAAAMRRIVWHMQIYKNNDDSKLNKKTN